MGQRILRISREFLLQMFLPGERHYEVIFEALPADTKIIEPVLLNSDESGFLLESAEWPDGLSTICPQLRLIDPASKPVKFREFL